MKAAHPLRPASRGAPGPMLQMFAAIYRKIPDADLRKYEDRLTSEAGRHLTGVLASAVEDAVVAGMEHFWQDLLPVDKAPSP